MVGNASGSIPFAEVDARRWVDQLCSEVNAWVIEADGRAIGDTRLHRLEAANRRARFAIGIFDPRSWGKGLGTEATRLVLQYAFEELGLHRVDLRVLTDNLRAIAAYEKAGFVREGVERETVADAVGWRSDLIMSILEDEYRRAAES